MEQWLQKIEMQKAQTPIAKGPPIHSYRQSVYFKHNFPSIITMVLKMRFEKGREHLCRRLHIHIGVKKNQRTNSGLFKILLGQQPINRTVHPEMEFLNGIF
jgi:hypothetical protein